VVCERKNDLPFGARQDRLDQLASAGAIDAGAVKSAVDALEVFGRVVEPQQAKDELNRALLLVGEQSNQERLRFRTTGAALERAPPDGKAQPRLTHVPDRPRDLAAIGP